MGIDRDNWKDIEPLTRLSMGVRHDRSGVLKRDYQTAGCARTDTIIKAGGSQASEGVVSYRSFLADAAFLVGMEGQDRQLLEKAHASLRNPFWALSLGRKSYMPSDPLWIEGGVQDRPLLEVLLQWPWIGTLRRDEELPTKLLLSVDSVDGSGTLRMDQPLSGFAERRFGARYVKSYWIPFPREVSRVSA
jgi:CRISPR system Cascade subunit CasD